MIVPSEFLAHVLEGGPWRQQVLVMFAISFVLITIGDAIIIRDRRTLRRVRRSAIVSFVVGLLAGICGLSWALAMLCVILSPVGIAAGWITLGRETANNERHSALNVVGLVLSSAGLLISAFQIFLAIYWSRR